MKHVSKHVPMLLFAAALALAGASAAQAFTFESTAPGDSGNARNYVDPQEQMTAKAGSPQRFSQPGQDGEAKSGLFITGPTQSFDQKYNSNDLFNPNRR
jgi:hypothetical protein